MFPSTSPRTGSKLEVTRTGHRGKMLRIRFHISIVIILFMMSCATTIADYSILETVPFPEYNLGTGPHMIGTRQGLSMGISGKYLSISTNNDTTVQAAGSSISVLRWRLSTMSEVGLALGLCSMESQSGHGDFLPYMVLDTKLCLLHDPIIITLDPGIGMGIAETGGLSYDLRCSCIVGKPLLYGIFVPYIAPRVIGLIYTWRRNSHGLAGENARALSPMYGFTGGFDFNAYSPSKSLQFHIIPEITVLKGYESTMDQINYTVIKPSVMLRVQF